MQKLSQNILFILLLLSAIGLATFVYFYEIRGSEEREAKKESEQKLLTFDKQSISFLSVRNSKGTFEFLRENGLWKMTAPLEAPADALAVDDVLFALEALTQEEIVNEAPTDPAAYGFSPPRFLVSFGGSGPTQSLEIGDKAPFGTSTYVRRGDNPIVYLINYQIDNKLEKDQVGWRNKKILDFSLSDVQRIEIAGAETGGFVGVRDGQTWFSSDHLLKFDTERVETLLSDIQGLSTKEFSSSTNAVEYGLVVPAATVRIEVGQDKTVKQLQLGSVDLNRGTVAVLRQMGEEILLVDASFMDKLKVSNTEMRSKKILSLRRFDIKKLEFGIQGQALTASKSTDAWTIEGSLKDKVTSAEIDSILTDLTQMEATFLIDGAPETDFASYGLTIDAISIAASPEGDGPPVKITVGKSSEGDAPRTVARVDSDPTLYALKGEFYTDLSDLLLKPTPNDASTPNAEGGPPSSEGSTPKPADLLPSPIPE